MLDKLKQKYYEWKYRDYAVNDDDGLEFIWGIKSYDDLSSGNASLYSMNDIDVTYDKKNKKYCLGIETIYDFDNEREGEINYISRLFDKLTEWMKSNGYDTEKKPELWRVFFSCKEAFEFDSIEDLYMTFKCLAIGFCTE